MSRGSEHRDRVPNQVVRRRAGQEFEQVLLTISEMDRIVISVLLTGADTVDGLAVRLGLSPAEMRRSYGDVIQRLRHPMRTDMLVESLPDDLSISSTALRDIAYRYTGRSEAPLQKCGHCEAPFLGEATGRPRRWCSNRCRQAAYNERRRSAKQAEEHP